MAKDKFKDLSSDFKDAVAQSSIDEIKGRMADLVMLQMIEKQITEDDPEIASAKAEYDRLMEPSREVQKELKQKLQFCKRVLEDKGAVPPSRDDD